MGERTHRTDDDVAQLDPVSFVLTFYLLRCVTVVVAVQNVVDGKTMGAASRYCVGILGLLRTL